MSDNNNHPLGEAPWLHVVLSTGFGSGFTPVAPGTAGAVAALVIWWLCYENMDVASLTWVTAGLIVVTTAVGVWTSNVMEHYWGHDSRTVNIDEFVGTWMPLLIAPADSETHTLWLALLGFALFRIIDMWKPLGCRRLDRMPGGWGVMLDDVLAGFYALIIVAVVKYSLEWT
ncbi:MAG: phosphatidylglycerophosphatase A [Bacteroidaceae bacterium]|nr:phosphatidylglycerophosphatase A [Bacteroidaceae bacterium]